MTKRQIFISYRRDDSSGITGRIYDRLIQHFAPENIFMDVDNVPPGENFIMVIQQAIDKCDVLIAVLGSRWLTIADKHGQTRLNNLDDAVRIEIGSALQRKIRVIPVLVEGATMPGSDELPIDLKSLSFINAVRINHTSFGADLRRLIEVLEGPKEDETTFKTSNKENGRHKKTLVSDNVVDKVKQSLEDLIEIIHDFEKDRDVDSFSNYFSKWKEQTNPTLLLLQKNGVITLGTDLYEVYADPNLTTVYTRLKNEARKCQRLVMDILENISPQYINQT